MKGLLLHTIKHPFAWMTWLMVWSQLKTKRTWLYLLVRFLQGAQKPKLGHIDELGGYVAEDGLNIEFGGGCPVQGEGTLELNGIEYQCYYRARGEGWSFDVELDGSVVFEHFERLYRWPEGGWLHHEESEANIRKAVAVFREVET